MGKLVVDMTERLMAPFGSGGGDGEPDAGEGWLIPGVDEEMADAFRSLLLLGAPQADMFSFSSATNVSRFVRQTLATSERLRQLASKGETPDDEGTAAVVDKFGLPLVLVLLHDGAVRDALIFRFVNHFEYVSLQHNQYLLFNEGKRAELRQLYETFFDELEMALVVDEPPGLDADVFDELHESDDDDDKASFAMIVDVLVDHHGRLWRYAQDLLKEQLGIGHRSEQLSPGDAARTRVDDADVSVGADLLRTPPCHEYDPQFQLSLWGVQPTDLLEPVLDIGCGEQGLLVQHLRDAGLEAWGLERFGGTSEFIWTGDWLEMPLEPGSWGTIISHMGFSNHFFHHHLRKDGHPERYARRFMEILEALKLGGRFLYAPGLPFFEPLLPKDRFQVVTHPIDVDLERLARIVNPQPQRTAGLNGTGGDNKDKARQGNLTQQMRQPALYATEIRRLS